MLTPAQLTVLQNDISADPALSQLPNNSDAAFDIAALYNTVAAPAFYVWRSSVPMDEIMQNGFDWTRVDNLTIGKARIWEWMAAIGFINPSRPNVRAGILAAFDGAGNQAMRLSIFNHCQAPATRAQKLFAVGAGAAVSADGSGPATTALDAPLHYNDVLTARSL